MKIAKNQLNKIYPVDCIKGMKKYLPDNSIDIIITSPPYNIGMSYNKYQDNRPFSEYLEWIENVSIECHRVLKEEGSFFFNIGDRPSDELRSFNVASRIINHFHLQNTIHWVKSIAIPEAKFSIGHYQPINSDRFLNNSHEYIFHFTKTGKVSLHKLAIGVEYSDKSNIGRWKHATKDLRGRGNQWFIPYPTVRKQKLHPAMFPVQLPEMCIKLHAGENPPNLVILDPFMGGGATALAAKKLKCHFIGFEIDKKYVEIAKKRLKHES